MLNGFFKEFLVNLLVGKGLDSLTRGNYIYSFMNTDPHNDFLKILVEVGFIGLFIYIFFILMLYKAVGSRFTVLIVLTVPLFLGNIVVNFPFNITLLLTFIYLYKQQHDYKTH